MSQTTSHRCTCGAALEPHVAVYRGVGDVIWICPNQWNFDVDHEEAPQWTESGKPIPFPGGVR